MAEAVDVGASVKKRTQLGRLFLARWYENLFFFQGDGMI